MIDIGYPSDLVEAGSKAFFSGALRAFSCKKRRHGRYFRSILKRLACRLARAAAGVSTHTVGATSARRYQAAAPLLHFVAPLRVTTPVRCGLRRSWSLLRKDGSIAVLAQQRRWSPMSEPRGPVDALAECVQRASASFSPAAPRTPPRSATAATSAPDAVFAARLSAHRRGNKFRNEVFLKKQISAMFAF